MTAITKEVYKCNCDDCECEIFLSLKPFTFIMNCPICDTEIPLNDGMPRYYPVKITEAE